MANQKNAEVSVPTQSPFAALLEQARTAADKVKTSITELTDVRQQLVDAQDQIDLQLVELRAMIGETNGQPTNERKQRGRPAGTSRGYGANGKNLVEYCYDALKKAGKKGLNKTAVAEAVIAAGFTTPSTKDQFAASCYVSGINKLMNRKDDKDRVLPPWVEYFSVDNERAGRYRLTAAGMERS